MSIVWNSHFIVIFFFSSVCLVLIMSSMKNRAFHIQFHDSLAKIPLNLSFINFFRWHKKIVRIFLFSVGPFKLVWVHFTQLPHINTPTQFINYLLRRTNAKKTHTKLTTNLFHFILLDIIYDRMFRVPGTWNVLTTHEIYSSTTLVERRTHTENCIHVAPEENRWYRPCRNIISDI